MKTRIQTLMDKWERAKTAYNKAVVKREIATLKLDEQILALSSQIMEIEKEHANDIFRTEVAVSDAEFALKEATQVAWQDCDVFPAGKKRLPLDRGAWVQISERAKRDVTDSSAAVRFIVEEGIEDTAIRKLTLEPDVVDAVMIVKRKFPGVYVSKVVNISISLPKTKAKKEE